MLILCTTDPFLKIWPRDKPILSAFEEEAALTDCDLNTLVFIPAYLRT